MIRLFIENKEIEIDNTVQVAITKQFEDLSNPTTVINDWSKTVSIPFTVNNNNIFGHIYSPDKAVVDGGTVGVYFNPLKKLSFRIEWDNTILMTGYAKLNEVKQVDGRGSYEITLFGQLGKVFQEMSKITFDTSTDDTDYLIDGSEYVEENINKDLIYNSWTSANQTQSRLQKKWFYMIEPITGQIIKQPNLAYKVTDIIGFAPNNSFSEGFDYKIFQDSNNTSKSFSDELGDAFTQDTGIEPSSILKNGLLPREIGEYRSYLQLPYIYWNKLFQIFKEKAESVTGFQFELDADWFSDSNPYWHNLVYMLKPFNPRLGTESFNQFISNITVSGQTNNEVRWFVYRSEAMGGNIDNTDKTYTLLLSNVRNVSGNANLYDSTNNTFLIANGENFNLVYRVTTALRNVWGNANAAAYYQDRTTLHIPLVCDLTISGSNGYTETKRAVIISDYVPSETRGIVNSADVVITENGHPTIATYTTTREWQWDIRFPDTEISSDKFGTSISLTVDTYFYKNTLTDFPIAVDGVPTSDTALLGYVYNDGVIINYNSGNKPRFHTGNQFILNDLWNKDYNLFSVILGYCKMYRIGVSLDEYNKKIIFKPITKYFQQYTVTDWTDKVDKSRDYVITPITFENKYVMFNYEDSDTKLGKEYKERFGVNYGDYRLITDYNFNTDTTDLFKEITPSITNTDNVLSWVNLNQNHKIGYSFPAEIYPYNKDKDNKQVDIFGAFFFHNGLSEFSTEAQLYMSNVVISDDSMFQTDNNTFFYTQSGSTDDTIGVLTYPKLDIVRDNNLCVFNKPKENYTYRNNYSEKSTIYSNFWENYLDERYNIQNKKITCYVTLKPHEYSQFKWNKLVKIGNQLCIVNKIYDYDITNNVSTKVDLITIQDIEGYTTNNYN